MISSSDLKFQLFLKLKNLVGKNLEIVGLSKDIFSLYEIDWSSGGSDSSLSISVDYEWELIKIFKSFGTSINYSQSYDLHEFVLLKTGLNYPFVSTEEDTSDFYLESDLDEQEEAYE